MLADIIEKWQPSIQLHRREIVTITAATTAVIAAKAVYSLAKQVLETAQIFHIHLTYTYAHARQKVLRQRRLRSCTLYATFCRLNPRVSPRSSRICREMDEKAWPCVQGAYIWSSRCDEASMLQVNFFI